MGSGDGLIRAEKLAAPADAKFDRGAAEVDPDGGEGGVLHETKAGDFQAIDRCARSNALSEHESVHLTSSCNSGPILGLQKSRSFKATNGKAARGFIQVRQKPHPPDVTKIQNTLWLTVEGFSSFNLTDYYSPLTHP